jgi:hypothetical protein
MVLYLCVLIVFSLHRESLKLILTTNPSRGGSVTVSHWLILIDNPEAVALNIVSVSDDQNWLRNWYPSYNTVHHKKLFIWFRSDIKKQISNCLT